MQKIMFNDRYGLTKAVLEGKKLQTRRIALLPQKEVQNLEDYLEVTHGDKSILRFMIDRYCHVKVGEILAVAQSYKELNKEYITNFNCELIRNGVIKSTNTRINIDDPVTDSPVTYWGENPTKVCSVCKNQEDCFEKYFRWIGSVAFENKMFVKAELLLHQIRITDIRLERLQDISDKDCLKEGIQKCSEDHRIGYPIGVPFNYFICEDKKGNRYTTPKEAYAALIDKVSGKGTWEKNPWVFVYNFELVK